MKTICILFILLSLSTPIFAHELETDNSVGAVIHISPDDDPVVGAVTNFFFEMKDKTGAFTPATCICTGSIIQDRKTLYTIPLFTSQPNPTLEDASFSYVFPAKGAYEVRLEGKPASSTAFAPFVLEWEVYISREIASSTTNNSVERNNWVYIALGVIGLGFIIYFIRKTIKPKNDL